MHGSDWGHASLGVSIFFIIFIAFLVICIFIMALSTESFDFSNLFFRRQGKSKKSETVSKLQNIKPINKLDDIERHECQQSGNASRQYKTDSTKFNYKDE